MQESEHQRREKRAAAIAPWRALVTIQRGGDHLPFFCVHGAGGNVLNFRDLSRGMSPVRPFYGLQASGVDGVSRPHGSINEMARVYLAEVRARQPQGPYLLGGYSGGGVVAFEMARLLTAAGHRVGLLALIDTMHPKAPILRMNLPLRLARFRVEGLQYVTDAVKRRRVHAKRAKMLREIEQHLARGETIPFELRETHLVNTFRRAVVAYETKPWAGRATLFRAERIAYIYKEAGPTYGWDRDVLGGVEIVAMAGDHHSVLLGKNAGPLGSALDAAIAGAAKNILESERVARGTRPL
jgi:thioesterase domain-containing protein